MDRSSGRMIRRGGLLALGLVGAAALVVGAAQRSPPQAGLVVLAPKAGPTAAPSVGLETVTESAPGPQITPMLAEAPPILRRLHVETAAEPAQDAAAAASVRAAFAGNPRLTDTVVTCTTMRCEVHGEAAADETVTRLMIRDGALLDALSAIGMTAGIDMVRQQDDHSSFLLYLDRAPPG